MFYSSYTPNRNRTPSQSLDPKPLHHTRSMQQPRPKPSAHLGLLLCCRTPHTHSHNSHISAIPTEQYKLGAMRQRHRHKWIPFPIIAPSTTAVEVDTEPSGCNYMWGKRLGLGPQERAIDTRVFSIWLSETRVHMSSLCEEEFKHRERLKELLGHGSFSLGRLTACNISKWPCSVEKSAFSKSISLHLKA